MDRLRLIFIIAMMLSVPACAHAGGAALSDEDLAAGQNGNPFFGFVRQVGGGGINDAKVTAQLKGGALVTRTEFWALQNSRFRQRHQSGRRDHFVRQGRLQASERAAPAAPSGDNKDPIEIDCFLEKQ